MTDTYSAEWLRECEVRHIASLAPAGRDLYLEGVARHRGQRAADRLRIDIAEKGYAQDRLRAGNTAISA
jgi:hypothetical protein